MDCEFGDVYSPVLLKFIRNESDVFAVELDDEDVRKPNGSQDFVGVRDDKIDRGSDPFRDTDVGPDVFHCCGSKYCCHNC